MSLCQSSSARPPPSTSAHLSYMLWLYHDRRLCWDTPGPMTSFNIQGVFSRRGKRRRRSGGHKADRSGRENSLFRPFCGLLQLPSRTFHLSACEIEPACPAHLLWPHYAATYTTLWWELLLWLCLSEEKKKKNSSYNLPPCTHTYNTPTHTDSHTYATKPAAYLSILCPRPHCSPKMRFYTYYIYLATHT